jgi:hypothetical protein
MLEVGGGAVNGWLECGANGATRYAGGRPAPAHDPRSEYVHGGNSGDPPAKPRLECAARVVTTVPVSKVSPVHHQPGSDFAAHGSVRTDVTSVPERQSTAIGWGIQVTMPVGIHYTETRMGQPTWAGGPPVRRKCILTLEWHNACVGCTFGPQYRGGVGLVAQVLVTNRPCSVRSPPSCP